MLLEVKSLVWQQNLLKRYILTCLFHISKHSSLIGKTVIWKNKMSHGGGGQESDNNVSHIIWMAP